MPDPTNPAPPDSGSVRTTATPDVEVAPGRKRRAPPGYVPPLRSSRVTTLIPLVLIVALGAFLRLYRIGAQPLWVDEATSLLFARRHPLLELWSWSSIVDPGNPPLYYSLLHGWLGFGDSGTSLRLLSASLGVLTIPAVYALGRTIRDNRLGIVGALLFAISPFQVWYSQEARGYALLTLGATSAMWGVAWLIRNPERAGTIRGARWPLLGYVLGTTVALLAHDTAVFLLIGANGLVLGWWWMRGRSPRGFLRTWVIAQLAVLALWATWLPAFLQQVAHGDAYSWIPRPTVRGVASGAYAIFAGVTRGTPYPLEAVFLFALGGLGLWSWRNDRRWLAFVLVFGLAAPVGELIVSVWRPIFLTQTLIWSAVPLCLTIAAGLLSLRGRVLAVAIVALVVFSGFGLRSYYYLHDKEAWDQVAAFVDRRLEPGDAIVFSVGFLHIPFDLYHSAPADFSVPEVELTGGAGDPAVALDETTSRSRVWLIVSHPKASTDGVIRSLGDAGQLIGFTRFTFVDVYLFDLATG